jgi:hypothetical protein
MLKHFFRKRNPAYRQACKKASENMLRIFGQAARGWRNGGCVCEVGGMMRYFED